MSEIGLIFYMVFGGNLLLEWGLPGYKPLDSERYFQNAIQLLLTTSLSTLLYGILFRHVLIPLDLDTMTPVVFMAILFGLHTTYATLGGLREDRKVVSLTRPSSVLPFSLVLFATSVSTASMLSSPFLLVLGGLAATLGYLAASMLLDDIVERLKLEPVPEAFRGIPIRFMSAGLIALVFKGIEAAFLQGLS